MGSELQPRLLMIPRCRAARLPKFFPLVGNQTLLATLRE
jgi:hypothetical protein